MIGALILALLWLTPNSEIGYRTATVQITGPIESVVFRVGNEEATRFVGQLAAGEEREFTLPFPESSLSQAPRVEVIGSGAATFQGWDASGDSSSLPRKLRHRTRPPLAAGESKAPLTALLLLVASGILALGLRRRPAPALVLALALGVAAGLLSAEARSGAVRLERVLEGDSREGTWLQVETSRGALECGTSLPEAVELAEGAGVTVAPLWSVQLGASQDPDFTLTSRKGELSSLRVLEPRERSIARDHNGFAALGETWTRAGAGRWRAHGPWKVGEPLPEALETGSSPPGWLASGLPQGVPILLGRVEGWEKAEAGVAASGGEPEARTWLRLVGF